MPYRKELNISNDEVNILKSSSEDFSSMKKEEDITLIDREGTPVPGARLSVNNREYYLAHKVLADYYSFQKVTATKEDIEKVFQTMTEDELKEKYNTKCPEVILSEQGILYDSICVGSYCPECKRLYGITG